MFEEVDGGVLGRVEEEDRFLGAVSNGLWTAKGLGRTWNRALAYQHANMLRRRQHWGRAAQESSRFSWRRHCVGVAVSRTVRRSCEAGQMPLCTGRYRVTTYSDRSVDQLIVNC